MCGLFGTQNRFNLGTSHPLPGPALDPARGFQSLKLRE